MSDHISVWLDLIDHQIVDSERRPFARIEDLELDVASGDPAPAVESLLVGAQAFGERFGGTVGRWTARTAARLRDDGSDEPVRIDPALIDEIDPLVKLSVPLRDLAQAAALERWLAHNLVARIPGAGDARD